MCPSSNTRWCPTPEQLMVLEELYRRGLRTPNASHIQKITAHLSRYGNIQGKNVFYWFQNHKARDRQKLRKKLATQLHHHLFHYPHTQFLHFHTPPPFSPNTYPFQGSGVCEEAPDGGVMRWDDSLMRRYGHYCSRSKPLQTLQLFPLTSTTAATPHSNSSIDN